VGQRQHEHDDAAEGHLLRIARSRARHGAGLVPGGVPTRRPDEMPDETVEHATSLMRREGMHRVLVGTSGRPEGLLAAFDPPRA
jgi:hypothetical protein